MKASESHITAAEAREQLRENLAESIVVNRFMDEVRENIRNKSNKFNFHIGTDTDLTDQEIDYISSLGYYISWNSACLWYEISFPIN